MPVARKPRLRAKPPEARREELLNAAQSLFLAHGVAQTTIEQITSGATVAKGTFYLYFSSKEDLLSALGERFDEKLLAGIKAAVARIEDGDWQGRLAAWADAAVSGYLDSMQLHDVLFYEARPLSRAWLTDNIVIDHLTALLEAGVAAKSWSIEDCLATAIFLFSGLHGLVDHAIAKERRVNRLRLALQLQQLCFRAVGLKA